MHTSLFFPIIFLQAELLNVGGNNWATKYFYLIPPSTWDKEKDLENGYNSFYSIENLLLELSHKR